MISIMFQRPRAGLLIAAVGVMLLGSFVACSDDSDAVNSFDDAPSMTFTRMLSVVSVEARGPVSFTNWAALHHRTSRFAEKSATSSCVRHAKDIRNAVGVGATDSDWQFEFALPGGAETITQWTDGGKLARLVDALGRHGWTRSGAGSAVRLTRPNPLEDVGWEWARNMDFTLDQARGLLVQYSHGRTPALALDQGLLNLPGVKTAAARTPDLLTGQIRAEHWACPVYGLQRISPAPSRAVVRRFVLAVGGLGRINAVIFGITSTDGRSGKVSVSLSTPSQASAELAQRQRAAGILSGKGGLQLTHGRQDAAIDTFRLTKPAAVDLYAQTGISPIGADSCGVN